MISYLNGKDIRPIIILALKEDIGNGDITTNAIFNGNHNSEAAIIAREEGIFCGSEVIKMVYKEIDPSVKITLMKKDGKKIKSGETAAKLKGHTKSILMGERLCMNFIQRMSGIATGTARVVSVLKGSGITLLDTRKTAPGLRLLDKYSVKCGGGANHRMGLFDMVLIKDNHIKAAGSITEAVTRVRNAYGKKFKIEVEAATVEQAKEAAETGVDIILLDNMDRETIKKSITVINKKAKIEISGNMTGERIKEICDLKINYISVGGLTHSVKAFDYSMQFL